MIICEWFVTARESDKLNMELKNFDGILMGKKGVCVCELKCHWR